VIAIKKGMALTPFPQKVQCSEAYTAANSGA
jgi:hypothetical protein